ncbi:hypothetical protein HBH71_155850 [Parastagonospora nodorum]|nr:hypothetical protein HBH72_221880 [Parastagonospora nodorum]KAH5113517.1 hypothetical protein HBH71_155850 [Parastagonospora nodorum]KAH5175836.1 hypothetical protein HBH76_219490 [Parastagonospora nodorum]KAH5753706.1 hypothetical protein HBI16_234490 [Parastagonospora nodorum]
MSYTNGRPKKSSQSLTASQLTGLKKGPKASIIVGPDDDHFIGLEGVSISLISHFSPYAKKKLIEERTGKLCIPNGSKLPVRWIYKYMQAGEKDPDDEDTFEQLPFDSLVLLYTHSAFLQYEPLLDRIVGRLKGKYHSALPTIEEITTFSAFIPPLLDYSARVLAHEMANPWACNYSAYLEYAKVDDAFEDALDKAMKDLLAHRIQNGKHYYATITNLGVRWSQNYYDNLKNLSITSFKLRDPADSEKKVASGPNNKIRRGRRGGKRPARQSVKSSQDTTGTQDETSSEQSQHLERVIICFNCREAHHIARDCLAKPVCFNCSVAGHASRDCTEGPDELCVSKKQAQAARVCYNCNEKGHIAKDCTAITKETAPKTKRQPFTRYNCLEGGHIARNCKAETKTPSTNNERAPPVCYNCTEEGHLARDCSAPAAGAYNSGPRDVSGRNRHFRRAQHDRVAKRIEVMGNGEGLRTCDREVRKGELTRTGLVV